MTRWRLLIEGSPVPEDDREPIPTPEPGHARADQAGDEPDVEAMFRRTMESYRYGVEQSRILEEGARGGEGSHSAWARAMQAFGRNPYQGWAVGENSEAPRLETESDPEEPPERETRPSRWAVHVSWMRESPYLIQTPGRSTTMTVELGCGRGVYGTDSIPNRHHQLVLVGPNKFGRVELDDRWISFRDTGASIELPFEGRVVSSDTGGVFYLQKNVTRTLMTWLKSHWPGTVVDSKSSPLLTEWWLNTLPNGSPAILLRS